MGAGWDALLCRSHLLRRVGWPPQSVVTLFPDRKRSRVLSPAAPSFPEPQTVANGVSPPVARSASGRSGPQVQAGTRKALVLQPLTSVQAFVASSSSWKMPGLEGPGPVRGTSVLECSQLCTWAQSKGPVRAAAFLSQPPAQSFESSRCSENAGQE